MFRKYLVVEEESTGGMFVAYFFMFFFALAAIIVALGLFAFVGAALGSGVAIRNYFRSFRNNVRPERVALA